MISKEDILKIAKLAKLSLTEADKDRYTHELGQIIHFVEKLNELKLENIEPTSHAVEVTNVFRKDVAVISPVKEKALASAPKVEENLFQVPRII